MRVLAKSAMMVATAALVFGFGTRANAQAPSDPQIVGIVLGANQIDIDQAKLALSKSKNKEVREFAQQMITDHEALQKSVKDLGAKLNVTPAGSDTATALKKQAAEETAKLKGLNGKAFDTEYLNNEIAYHKQVIDAATNVLIPNAKNPELKSALTSAAPLFQGHLQHAEQSQKAVAGTRADAGHSQDHSAGHGGSR